MALEITDANFDELVLKSDKPVVVEIDFISSSNNTVERHVDLKD